tara:strand:- start:10625 stop:11959 length:1335 start_codon:yes stop_codon:yes gene_type:complete
MSHKFGLGNMVNNSLGGSMGNTGGFSSPKTNLILKVKDIILDENHPKFNPNLGFSQIGTIFGVEKTLQNSATPRTYIAKPSNPNSKNFPIPGENVKCFSNSAPNSPTPVWVYESTPISDYGVLSPHSNQSPSPTVNTQPSSQQMSYEDVSELGVFNIKDEKESEELKNVINSSNPSQNTFIEKDNIKSLMYYSGDILYEGRWGQSIRFGSTTKSKSRIQNNYSSIGNNGDPIMIIRNGQSKVLNTVGIEPIVEDIRNDLSSIYLTSTQQLKGFKVAGNENYSAFPSSFQPIPPSLYSKPQIAINSDRIVINAQENSILLSAKKQLSISIEGEIDSETGEQKGGVGITSPAFYIGSNKIRLGSNDAKEPILKGNITVSLLKSLVESVEKLAQILEVEKNWPQGALVTSNNTIATNAKTTLQDLLKQLNLDESKPDSLKSYTSKVK